MINNHSRSPSHPSSNLPPPRPTGQTSHPIPTGRPSPTSNQQINPSSRVPPDSDRSSISSLKPSQLPLILPPNRIPSPVPSPMMTVLKTIETRFKMPPTHPRLGVTIPQVVQTTTNLASIQPPRKQPNYPGSCYHLPLLPTNPPSTLQPAPWPM